MSTTAFSSSARQPFEVPAKKIGFDLNSDGSFEIWIEENDEREGESLAISRDDVNRWTYTILAKWQDLIGKESGPTALQTSIKQDALEADATRVKLAAVGNYVVHELFEKLSPPFKDKFSAMLQSLVQERTSSVLHVVSREMIPWRMLYLTPGDTDREVDDNDGADGVPVNGFLGMAGIVDQQMARRTVQESTSARSSAFFAFNAALTTNVGARRSDIEAAMSNRSDLDAVFIYNEDTLVEELRKDGATLVYVFAHGKFRLATAGRPVQELIFRRNKSLTAWELERRLKKIVLTRPIGIINACQGGVWSADGLGLINILRDHGAGGISGPVVDMPIKFGAGFGADVVERLASSSTLGQALLDSTRIFAERDRNPLGLAYLSINGARATLPMIRKGEQK